MSLLRSAFWRREMNAAKKMKSGARVAGVLVLLLCLPIWAVRGERSAKDAAQENKGKATPEMDRLKFYLGEWDYTETYGKSPSTPNSPKNTGLYTSKLGPGGNSLINTFHSQGPVGDFEGLLVMTWDAKEKAYKAYVFGNDFPGALVETGPFEGDALVFRAEVNAGGATMKFRNVARLISPGKMESEAYVARGDAPENLLVHVEAKKR
jgi:hypothetical protein